MPAPGNALLVRQQDLDLRPCPGLALDQPDSVDIPPRRQPFAKTFRIGQRCRQRRSPHARRNRL